MILQFVGSKQWQWIALLLKMTTSNKLYDIESASQRRRHPSNHTNKRPDYRPSFHSVFRQTPDQEPKSLSLTISRLSFVNPFRAYCNIKA